MSPELKEKKLREIILEYGSLAVAYSGGVDSSLLCAIAQSELGDKAIAFTVASPFLTRSELDSAREFAKRIGIRHEIIEDEGIPENVAANPKDRCYHCKKLEFGYILRAADKLGFTILAEGSNLDDLADYRPGARAVGELGVRSPLRDAGLTKSDIRELSRRLGLPTWNKPALACLASRIPYGERIDLEKLERIERAEDFLRSLGFNQFRVRSHDTIARIEIAREERSKLFDEAKMDKVSSRLKSLGFLYVCVELEGYKMGSMNRSLT